MAESQTPEHHRNSIQHFERVIRAHELEVTRGHILQNPLRWQLERERAA